MVSKWHHYSIGMVVKDLVAGELEVEVWPVEIVVNMNGQLDGESIEYGSNGIDAKGTPYDVKLLSSESITCEWLKETHRRTAPNVRAGERVDIWRFGDSDTFYWSSKGREDHLRRGERIVYSWSDVPESDVGTDADLTNSYTLEIDTFNGLVEFTTVKANEEPFRYQWTINTKEGFFRLMDDVGNFILLNSTDTLIHLENKEGTFVKLDKQNISAYAPDSMFIEAVNLIKVLCTDLDIFAKNSIKMKTKDYSLNASNSIAVETKTYTFKGKTMDTRADNMTYTGNSVFNGPVAINGPLSCKPSAAGGGATLGGSVKITGGLTVDDITFTSSITGPSGEWHYK